MTNPDKRRVQPYDRHSRHYEQTGYPNREGVGHNYDNDMVNQTPDVANGGRDVPTQTTYQSGYADGRIHENRVQDLRARDNDNAARGMLIGIILMSFVGLVIGILFFLAGQNRTEVIENPTAVPLPNVPTEPEITDDTEPVIRERVIERTEIVPVPQPQQPAPQGQVQQAPVQQAPVQQAPVQQAPVEQTTPSQPQGNQGGQQIQPSNQVVEPAPAPAAGTAQ